VIRAYLEGFFVGKGIKEGFVFTDESPYNLEAIKERFKFHGETLHLICEASLRGPIGTAIKKAPEEMKLEVVETAKVTRAYFHFEFDTANRPVAGRIKRIFSSLPRGVCLTDFEPEEIINPQAKGVEGYAPLHSYLYKGSGVVEGDAAGVHEVYKRMDQHAHFDLHDIDIHH
jgi:hypothetical protein